MRTPVALMLYPALAPTEVASLVVTASVADGNPINAIPAKAPGWTFMVLKLRPLDELGSPNYSLIITKLEPKQTAETEGSQGGYLQKLRARMHSHLQAGGDFELANKRLADYKAMEASSTVPGKEWGAPRKPGRQQIHAATPGATKAGVRGIDKGTRRRRRDEYVVYTSPHGEELMILASSKHGRDMIDNGAYVPSDWTCHRAISESHKDDRPLMRRLRAMKTSNNIEEHNRFMLELFLLGRNHSVNRQPVTRQTVLTSTPV